MAAPLQGTVWPEIPPPTPIRKWLEDWYTATSTNSQHSTDVLVDSITEDGAVINNTKHTKGRKDFREWRDHAWDHIEDRKHEIFNVYTAKPDYSDIMVLGLLTGSFRNGKIVSEEYIARITFDPATLATEPKSHYYKVWTDSVPWTAALRG